MKRILGFVLLCVGVFTMTTGAWGAAILDNTTEHEGIYAALAAIKDKDNRTHTIH